MYWKNKKNIFKVFLFIFLLSFIVVPNFSFADIDCPSGKSESQMTAAEVAACGMKTTRERAGYSSTSSVAAENMIYRTISVLLSFVGVFFLILTIYGGILWMTAGGSEEQMGKAKKVLRNAIIGVLVILGAYAITNFVMSLIG